MHLIKAKICMQRSKEAASMQIYLKSKYGFGLSIQGRRGIIRFNNSQKTGATYLLWN